MLDLQGKRVVIMGLGRFGGGVGAARFCAKQGAHTLVTDLLDERALAESKERREKAKKARPAKELGGRDGPDPVRFGDWEKKGIAIDF